MNRFSFPLQLRAYFILLAFEPQSESPAAVKQFSDAGDAVQKTGARAGLSTEAVSEFAHAAHLSGTEGSLNY